MDPKILSAMTRVRPAGRGFAAEGCGFFLWDEDRHTVVETLAELEGRRPARPRPARDRARTGLDEMLR